MEVLRSKLYHSLAAVLAKRATHPPLVQIFQSFRYALVPKLSAKRRFLLVHMLQLTNETKPSILAFVPFQHTITLLIPQNSLPSSL
jgi:hypothetical protein